MKTDGPAESSAGEAAPPVLREARPALRIKDMELSERPRERLARLGARSLSAPELVAILLRTGTRRRNVIRVAEELLANYDYLSDLAQATREEIQQIPGIGRDKAVTLSAAFELARRMAEEKRGEKPLLDTPDKITDLLREETRHLTAEQFFVVLLNSRRRLIRVEKLSQGTLDTLLVHPRDVFRAAILARAAAVVLAHNHPSGDPAPSEADIRVTRDLIRAGQIMKIEVLDHVILGHRLEGRERDFLSLRELGYFHS